MTIEERRAEIEKQHPKYIFDRVDRNQTLYYHDPRCDRCGGTGRMPYNVDSGICWRCGGSGRDPKPSAIKFYTEAHEAKLAAQRAERQAKRNAERLASLAASYDERMEKLGFGKEGDEYVIYRIYGETFSIKDELKELGCRFNPQLGWYSPKALEDHPAQRMTREMVLNDTYPLIEFKTKDECRALFDDPKPENTSKFIGQIGDKITIEVTVKFSFENTNVYYGHTVYSYMYIMTDDDGNYYKWSTAKFFKVGEKYKIAATVKDHVEYKGTAQTVITRGKEVA